MDLNNFDRINKYLNHLMNDEERDDFENEIANDSNLRREFLIQKI